MLKSIMAMIDTYRNNIIRKRQELAKFHSDKASESKKIADFNSKINSANQAIVRIKSQATINSKLREIEVANKSIAISNKKIADIELKIARLDREILNEEKKLRAEEERERKKLKQDDKKRMQETTKQFNNIASTLRQHSAMHQITSHAIGELQKVPTHINVLFMASNPIDQLQLRLDEEARAIMEMIRKSDYRDSITFETRWALRPLDVLQAINEVQPSIVHFSGHGSDMDEIIFQNPDGSARFVSKEAMVQTMMASSEHIRLVFFNTCYSYGQAEAVVQYVEAAIGMNTSIGDEAARIFAAQFYSAIGFGLSVKRAFEQAKAALMLEDIAEEDTPELFVQDGLDANEIVIVKP